MFYLKQIIREHTRVDLTSSTLDIILSDSERICQSGVLKTCLSEHFTFYCTRKATKIMFASITTLKHVQ
jgi:hypothetical protein